MNWLEQIESFLKQVEQLHPVSEGCGTPKFIIQNNRLELHLIVNGQWLSFWFSKEELESLSVESLLEECIIGAAAYLKQVEASLCEQAVSLEK